MKRAGLDDVPALSELVNDPLIRPSVGGEGHLDPTALLADRRNVCLFNDEGGAFFAWRGPGIFEGHSFFRCRGRRALDLGAEILGLLDARMVWGLTPADNRAAAWFNRQLGFKSHGMVETPEGPRELFVLEK